MKRNKGSLTLGHRKENMSSGKKYECAVVEHDVTETETILIVDILVVMVTKSFNLYKNT